MPERTPCTPCPPEEDVSKSTWCLTSTETVRLIGDGEKRVWRWGKRDIIYLSLHCHHQNDFCIKMGSAESHFNVSVGSDGQSQDNVHKHNLSEEKGEPKRYRTEVLPLTSLTARPNRLTKRMYLWWSLFSLYLHASYHCVLILRL